MRGDSKAIVKFDIDKLYTMGVFPIATVPDAIEVKLSNMGRFKFAFLSENEHLKEYFEFKSIQPTIAISSRNFTIIMETPYEENH